MFTNKDLKRLILPLLFEQILGLMVGMLDTVMVSSVGEAAISGVSIVNDVNLLIIALLSALAGGGSVCVSQFFGNGDNDKTRLSASQLIMISFVVSFIFGLIGLFGAEYILKFLYPTVSIDVMSAARIYFVITALSFPFLGLYNAAAALFRCMARTKVTLYVSILGNIINLVGNYFCIYILKIGVAGVAIPTLVSRAVMALILLVMCFNEHNEISVQFKNMFRFDRNILNKILTIAIPNSVENGLFNIGKIIISTFVATYGTVQIAANGVANSVCVLCYATDAAMQLAIVTVIGRCVGASDYDQTRYYIKKMMIISLVLCLVSNIMVYLALPLILNMYTLSEEARSITRILCTMDCIFMVFFHSFSFVFPCALRAAGDARYTMYAGAFSMFVFRCLGAYVLGTVCGLGVIGTWTAMFIDWIVRIAFFVIRYKSNKWMEYRVV